ncbi:MAG TPA: MoxR family ATPase [Polyangiaceae bacterium]|nr:MoxR family ATPase [Polyangiaceae bacterium]
MNAEVLRDACDRILAEVGRVLVGPSDLIREVVVALLAGGHVLIEGVPGVGKTLLVRALSAVLGAEFKRIQFTPDLMPADVTGGNVFDARRGDFNFIPGPVFTQLLLADEVNRAPAKTQSALLEAMQEATVTTDGKSRPLPSPFLVIATQNPIESQGTYPLPEAQLDRFLFKLLVVHPPRETEKHILRNFVAGFDSAKLERAGLGRVCSPELVLEMQAFVRSVRVDEQVLDYITDIVGRTRAHPSIYLGASPRGSLGLVAAARAHAAMQGRDFVIPDDVKAYAPPVLRHRVVLQPDAELANLSADDCIQQITKEAPVPRAAR